MNEILIKYCDVLSEEKYSSLVISKEKEIKFFPKYLPIQEQNQQNQQIKGVVTFVEEKNQTNFLCSKKSIKTRINIFIYTNGRVDNFGIDDYCERLINKLKTIQQIKLTNYRIIATTSVELLSQIGFDNNNNEVYQINCEVSLGTL